MENMAKIYNLDSFRECYNEIDRTSKEVIIKSIVEEIDLPNKAWDLDYIYIEYMILKVEVRDGYIHFKNNDISESIKRNDPDVVEKAAELITELYKSSI